MSDVQNGQAEYGIRHVDEEAMRKAGEGVFETLVGDEAAKHRAKKPAAKPAAPVSKVSSKKAKANG